jgi:uncharacterized protein YecE (DUF72 family)
VLQDCDEDLKHFLETMDLMGDKLGPLLFQFGYFNQTVFRSGAVFLARLEPFLKKLPKGYKFAVEIRNKNWLSKPFVDLLRAQGRLRADRSSVDARTQRDLREIWPHHGRLYIHPAVG